MLRFIFFQLGKISCSISQTSFRSLTWNFQYGLIREESQASNRWWMLWKRLTRWKGRRLSLGGRITLLRSVLSSIPLYYLSLFRIVRKVPKILIGIQRSFLWLIKFHSLGFKHLDIFNLSLLRKWRWRVLVDKEAYWYSILHSRYGALNQQHEPQLWNSKNSSQRWRDYCALDFDKSALTNWFSNGLRWKVGILAWGLVRW